MTVAFDVKMVASIPELFGANDDTNPNEFITLLLLLRLGSGCWDANFVSSES